MRTRTGRPFAAGWTIYGARNGRAGNAPDEWVVAGVAVAERDAGLGLARAEMIERLCLGDHVCWIFRDDGERLRVAAGYVRQGLRLGHKVMFLTEGLLPTALIAGLENLEVQAEDAVTSGQLEVRTAAETYLAGGRFDPAGMLGRLTGYVEAARGQGWSGFRLAGDMSWAAEPVPGRQHIAWFEAQANQVFAQEYAMGVCFYDRGLFTRAELDLVTSAHPAMATPEMSGQWEPLLRIAYTSDPVGLRLSGEIDVSNRQALAAVLARRYDELDDRASPVVIDVSGLRFADGAALAMLVRAAQAAPGGLRLVGCSAALARLFDVVAAGAPARVVVEHAV